MDGNGGMNFRNGWQWQYYEPMTSLGGHLGLQLTTTGPEKPIMGGRPHPAVMVTANGGPFHHHRVCSVSDPPVAQGYMRDAWMNSTERYVNLLQRNQHPNFTVLPENTGAHPHPSLMLQQADSSNDERGVAQLEETGIEMEGGSGSHPIPKKRSANKTQKSPKTKKAKRAPRAPKDECSPSVHRARVPKKSAEVFINGIDMDISGIPIPVCSCTGTPQQCYRWGSGGWQSACCTTGMSMYPLPMSTKRRGARIAGRKMSLGAFKKVLEKLAAEGYYFSNPIDLRTHWAKHGTNKFVTIR